MCTLADFLVERGKCSCSRALWGKAAFAHFLHSSSVMEEDMLLVEALDASDEYLAAIDRLSTAMRQAYFSLAQARYSMGVDKVGALQYDSSYEATALVRATVDSEDCTRLRLLPVTEQSSGAKAQGQDADQSRSESSCQSRASDDSSQTPERQLERPGEFSSLISELAEKFGCGDAVAGEQHGQTETVRKRKEPLWWISGGLVPPALRAAQRQSLEAVALAVEAANCKAQLGRVLKKSATA